MRQRLTIILFTFLSLSLQGQVSIELKTPQTVGGTQTACQTINLKPGFSFKSTIAANGSMILRVNPTTCDPFNGQQSSVSANQNYIQTKTYTMENGSRYLEAIQYFDGLGRPVQTVQRAVTPKAADLVTYQEYDPFGREDRSWLPAVASGNNGAFMALATYKPKAMATYSNDSAYSRPVYEASPLNRVMEQYGPGKEWYAGKKAVKTDYKTNIAGNATLNCIWYQAGGTNQAPTVTRNGNYPTGQLFVTEMKDEDGNTSYEFKDKLGQVILTRQMVGSSRHDTYYVYNDFGNLCFVLPPRIDDEGLSLATLNTLGYQYKYDNRNRCIWKKLPGCEHILYVYDKADRLIFTQDGEQRTKGEWTFSISDALGRPVLAGICKNSITNAAYENTLVSASYGTGAGTYKGYSITNFTPAAGYSLLSVNYYDNYDFLEKGHIVNNDNTKYLAEPGYGIAYGDHQAANKAKSKGLLTGTLTAQMNPAGGVEGTYLYSVMYYDYRGRLVQAKSNNQLTGGVEKEYIAYNFTGQPTQKKHVHSADGKTPQTEVYAYTYDHAGRLLSTKHKLNAGTEVILAENTYDELGRLASNKKGSLATAEAKYAYNIRSWTKTIASPLFNQTLYYNEPYGGNTGQYNGNISAMNWKQNNEAFTRGYAFKYDNLSRLTAANYLVNAAASDYYKVPKITYDKHGNIINLQRHGKKDSKMADATAYALVDDLTITYAGNQMTHVKDAITNFSDGALTEFKDKQNVVGTIEYTYNANGAMSKDLNKGITEIQYNSLNLPRQMVISSAAHKAKNYYTYSASGVKLKTEQRYDPNRMVTPSNATNPTNDGLTDYTNTDYVGNVIYEKVKIGTNITDKTRILVDGGYYEAGTYYYYLTDHLGNNRVVVNSSGTVTQRNHYYPFGTAFADTPKAEQGKQPYKYNGKELDDLHEVNLYDYSARYYESVVGRFTSVDPLAEKYYSISPYVYCVNNPLKYTDPKGDTIRISINDAATQTTNSYYYGADTNGNYGFIGANGVLYSGNDAFANSLTTALGKLREKEAGRVLVDDLTNSTNTVTIGNSSRNIALTSSNEIGWNDANVNPYSPRPGFVGLGHEMAHIQAAWNNTTFPGTMPTVNGTKIDDSEIYTTHIENQIRAEHRISLRTHYAYDANGNGVNSTRVVNAATSTSLFYTQQQTNSITRIVDGSPVVTNTIVNVPFIYRGY